MSSEQATFLRRAIRLAMNGRGRVEPNPMVGCVLVRDGHVIGEGFHREFGAPHAEPNALLDCRSRSQDPRGATAYVTLEPCCHTNKKTPPCAPRLVEAGIARVVIGALDPNPEVNGNGVAMLRAAGVEVIAAPQQIQAECRQLIAPFIALTTHRRPYVTLKWAQTADGHVAGPRGQRLQISNEASNRIVHELRARCDAIAVGTNTVLSDDPLLTARGVDRPRPLLRVILSNTLKIPIDARVVQTARHSTVIAYCARSTEPAHLRSADALRGAGVEIVEFARRDDNRFSLPDVLADLAERKVTHLLIEPGPTLAGALLSRGQADRVWVFQSRKTLAAAAELAISKAPAMAYPPVATLNVDGDVLTEYLNPESQVFFTLAPSADCVLSQIETSTSTQT